MGNVDPTALNRAGLTVKVDLFLKIPELLLHLLQPTVKSLPLSLDRLSLQRYGLKLPADDTALDLVLHQDLPLVIDQSLVHQLSLLLACLEYTFQNVNFILESPGRLLLLLLLVIYLVGLFNVLPLQVLQES